MHVSNWLRTIWFGIGVLMVAAVLYLSLSSSLQIESVFSWQDKLFHVFAYLGLTLWFLQLSNKKLGIIITLIAIFSLGLGIEYLQGFTENRFREGWDAVANGMGVLTAALLKPTPLGRILD